MILTVNLTGLGSPRRHSSGRVQFPRALPERWTETEKFALTVSGTVHRLETRTKLTKGRGRKHLSTSIPFFCFLTEAP